MGGRSGRDQTAKMRLEEKTKPRFEKVSAA